MVFVFQLFWRHGLSITNEGQIPLPYFHLEVVVGTLQV